MLLTAVLIASVQSGWGQTISGCVSDTEGNPVIGARVTFENSEGDRFIAISGEDGSYTIHFGFPPTVVSSTGGFSSAFNLQQNYPNPFNPFTNIRFNVPIPGAVSIRIFDSNGHFITELLNKTLSPGYREIQWNGSAKASGVYFVKLESGPYSQVQKIILLK